MNAEEKALPKKVRAPGMNMDTLLNPDQPTALGIFRFSLGM